MLAARRRAMCGSWEPIEHAGHSGRRQIQVAFRIYESYAKKIGPFILWFLWIALRLMVEKSNKRHKNSRIHALPSCWCCALCAERAACVCSARKSRRIFAIIVRKFAKVCAHNCAKVCESLRAHTLQYCFLRKSAIMLRKSVHTHAHRLLLLWCGRAWFSSVRANGHLVARITSPDHLYRPCEHK